MKTKHILPIFAAVMSFGLAQATIITISNPWNFDGTTNWTVTGSTDLVVNPDANGDTVHDIFRWSGAGGWTDRSASDDTGRNNIGGNIGANRRTQLNVSGTPAGPAPDGSGNFLWFSIENTGSNDLIIDGFSFGIGHNRPSSGWLYTSIFIGSEETPLTADATSESSSVNPNGGWDDPLVQFAPGGTNTNNAWAKPVYSGIGLILPANQTAEFRISDFLT